MWLIGESGAAADPPDTGSSVNSGDAQTSSPKQNFLQSLTQAFKQDFDHAVVRGHFEVGTAPGTHRYYCLVDAKSGKSQPNGVAGEPVKRPDGMTGIKASAVSVFSCSSAEEQGNLVTAGYVLSPTVSAKIAPAAPSQKPVAPALPDISPDKLDVAGVKLGMSVDQVRSVLKSKKLRDYYESTETLGHPASAKAAQSVGGRFVNVIAAWTPGSSASGDPVGDDGESYEVMFTPVPGQERVMAIVHSAAYWPADAVHETALAEGLVKKYGGFAASSDMPQSPTWRIQSGGTVQVGDACNRRGIFGGAGGLNVNVGSAVRRNLALKTTPDEFRFQIDNCGVAILTEDHSTANGGVPRQDRIVTRFTVTAYSPSIAFEGATAAAQLMQSPGEGAGKAKAPRNADGVPSL
jgi:hypothetical protein